MIVPLSRVLLLSSVLFALGMFCTLARRNLVISELYQQEGFTVSDKEIEERVAEMRTGFGGDEATDERC